MRGKQNNNKTDFYVLLFLDGNNSYLEETERARDMRCDSPEDDFDRLLKMATKNIKKRKELTPEWD